MAYSTLTPTVLGVRTSMGPSAGLVFTAVATDGESTPTYGAKLSAQYHDERTVVLVRNDHATVAKTVTLKKGNGGIADTADVTFTVPATKEVVIAFESMQFKHVKGDDKGNIIFVGESTDIKIAVVILP